MQADSAEREGAGAAGRVISEASRLSDPGRGPASRPWPWTWPWTWLGLALAAALAPPLLRGDVLYPHDNVPESGGAPDMPEGLEWWAIDVSALYVPEAAGHLSERRSGWLATWNAHNELGRPLFQTGAGDAFLLTRVISAFTSDPFVHYTWTTLLAVVLAGVFAMGFLLERGFHPVAAWAGAVGISIGPLFPAWSLLPLVQWGYAWAFASLWAAERWLAGGSRWNLVGAAFAVHGILMTGFQQHVLGLGWIVALYVLFRSPTWRSRPRALAGLALAAAVGVASVMPAYIDLFVDWSRSTRSDYPVSAHSKLQDMTLWLLFRAGPEHGPGPASYSIGPAYSLIAILGALRFRDRRTWLFTAAALAVLAGCTSAAASRVFFLLGMAFSNWPPHFLLHLPVTVLAAAGIDLLVRTARASSLPFALRALPLAAALAGVLLAAASEGRRLTHWQPRDAIATDSPLAHRLRELTSDGSRYVFVGRRPRSPRFLPPNVDQVLGLRSLCSYYHVPSRDLHDWLTPLRPEAKRRPYERRFEFAEAEGLTPDVLAVAGTTIALSVDPLPETLGSDAERIGDFYITRLTGAGPLEALVPLERVPVETSPSAGVQIPPRNLLTGDEVRRVDLGVDDRLRFEFEPATLERVLFVSQQFHPRWHATSDGSPAATTKINGLFQGVVVAPGVSEVELRFEPFARWMAISQLLFVLAAGAALIRSFALRR